MSTNKRHSYQTINDSNLTVLVRLIDVNNLLADITISVKTIEYGFITIKNFKIWKSNHMNERLQEAINITPPAFPSHGRYIDQVFIEDAKFWFSLEERIYDAYHLARNKIIKNEDIAPDEIKIDDY